MKRVIPIIALIGQANVGKSSIFNLALRSKRNIVAKEPGTTRDSISQLLILNNGQPAWLVDTAGLKNPEDDFEQTIQDQIQSASQTAHLICLVIEAHKPLNQTDRTLAKKALKSKKPVILVVNKLDLNHRAQASDFLKLGIKDIFLISTTTKAGWPIFLDYLSQQIPLQKPPKTDEAIIKVALLGRPNVGKSALFNALIKKQQAIVSPKAHTTRDLNQHKVRFEQKTIELYDTAGLRKSGKIERGVEKFSVLRTLQAIGMSDVCLLLIDVNELAVAMEQKIAGMVKDACKGLIIVISKWDTLLEKDIDQINQITFKIKREFDFVPWANLIFVSSVTGQNVSKIFELITQINQRQKQKIKTSQLNTWLKTAILSHPPAGLKNMRPKLNYVLQINNDPPVFQFFGGSVKYLHWSYKRFLEKRLREEFDYQGVGLQFIFKEKH